MQAIVYEQTASAWELHLKDVPIPRPGEGQLRIRVRAAAVTPTELQWYPTTHTADGRPRIQAIPGHEFAGEVVELGTGVEGFSPGDLVYGMNDWFADGAMAEYCLTTPDAIARLKGSATRDADWAVAMSVVPISALTAWQGLYTRAALASGEQVLIHGGGGAVGLFAVQLAVARGARVVTTASERDRALLLDLGAEKVLDYRRQAFDATDQKYDVIFDTVGGETLARSWGLLAPGGRMVTVAAAGEQEKDSPAARAFFIVEPEREQLESIASRIEHGELRVFVDRTIPLALVTEAYRQSIPRQGPGKIAVRMA